MLTFDRLHTQDITIRPAEPHEAKLVRHLDDSVFPERSEDLQRAQAGELEAGIEAKDVYLFELDARLVAYLHVDRSDRQRVYLAGFGVLPELQNQGLGTALIAQAEPILKEYEEKVPIYTVTSPRNARMLRILFSLRFAGRWVLPDHFGPGRHRIGCQLMRPDSGLKGPARTQRVRRDDIPGLARLAGDGWVILDQHQGRTGPVFELGAAGPADFLPCPPPAQPGAFRTAIAANDGLT